MGCAARAFEPQRRMTSVSSTSAYELVPPPAPKTVARPTTLGACHVLLQLSMLCEPNATRASFCAAKFTSFVDFEQEKMPVEFGPRAAMFRRKPSAAASRATSHDTGFRTPPSRTIGWVIRTYSRGAFLVRRGVDPGCNRVPLSIEGN